MDLRFAIDEIGRARCPQRAVVKLQQRRDSHLSTKDAVKAFLDLKLVIQFVQRRAGDSVPNL